MKKCLIKPNRELPFVNHHPWVFSGAIRKPESDIKAEIGRAHV
jgi:hypothetical protein